METLEFKNIAKKNGIKVYKISGIKEGENKGYRILSAKILGIETVSKQRVKDYWNQSLDEIAEKFSNI